MPSHLARQPVVDGHEPTNGRKVTSMDTRVSRTGTIEAMRPVAMCAALVCPSGCML